VSTLSFKFNFLIIFLHVKRDAQGQTPLMLAVSVRAYHAALILLDTIQRVGKDAKDTSAMILPADASPDLSPLFVTCCNDTCSFTWTGAEHINQVLNLYTYMSHKRRIVYRNFFIKLNFF